MTHAPRTACRLFDLLLPRFPLEGGARLPHHVVRGWWWGPERDLAWIEGQGLCLPEAAQVLPGAVVRRSLAEVAALGARAEAQAKGPPPDPEIPTILCVHALTGDMRAGGPGGWWAPLVGPGAPLDPTRYRVLCLNNLGSCYGTTGPADEGYPHRADDARFGTPAPRGKGARDLPEGALPASLTPWDQARSLLLALDTLGLRNVRLATGGSVGGAIVLCLGALDPLRFERLMPIAASEAATPWQLGWSHVGRQAILLDPGFPAEVTRGLELARQIAHLTYRAEPGLQERQGRRQSEDEALGDSAAFSTRVPYRMHSYLEHQGTKLRDRFHALAYLAQLDALDHHDLARPPLPPGPRETWPWDAPAAVRPAGPFMPWHRLATPDPADSFGLRRLRARVLGVSIDTDQLYFPEHMVWLCERLGVLGVDARHRQIQSPHGHDAFLIEWDQVANLLREALG